MRAGKSDSVKSMLEKCHVLNKDLLRHNRGALHDGKFGAVSVKFLR